MSSLFLNIEPTERIIKFYPKKEATWAQINSWFEKEFPNPAFHWKGFGTIGTDDFTVILFRRADYDDEEDMANCTCDGEHYECMGCDKKICYEMTDGGCGICLHCDRCGDCGCDCETCEDEDEEPTNQ